MLKKIVKTISILLLVIILAGVGYGAKVYFDVRNTAKGINTPVERQSNLRDKNVDIDSGQPFSVLLLGLDTGDKGRTDQGRSDTMLLATVNPKQNQTTLVSLPRDTYTEIIGHEGNTKDKLNHAYAFGGAAMAMDTVENLFQTPVDHYVTINMKGLQDLVDAVGGITVDNQLEFSQDGFDFPVGTIKLNGESALSYSRMRYEDPNGDYGRQERQRKIIQSVVDQAMSVSSVTGYTDILRAISDNMKTDLSWDDMIDISTKYRSAFGTVQDDGLKGDGVMLDGVSYQEVSDSELARVKDLLNSQLK
ncbi:LCP family glycopolymer transferase [Vagococcus intermedius]|uniref:LCP family protein n=1 Tax=Vagococcus intermedius TaxID=2991418 RepID=A0AAF0I7Z2_9ENTE|nr:LCP family protein [Vagococcus intermedius]WEG73800.1 LCP family protein [Vagococcus intermedius]WEG75885.1 LCP family protein [Vagococcus intermedius]